MNELKMSMTFLTESAALTKKFAVLRALCKNFISLIVCIFEFLMEQTNRTNCHKYGLYKSVSCSWRHSKIDYWSFYWVIGFVWLIDWLIDWQPFTYASGQCRTNRGLSWQTMKRKIWPDFRRCSQGNGSSSSYKQKLKPSMFVSAHRQLGSIILFLLKKL